MTDATAGRYGKDGTGANRYEALMIRNEPWRTVS